MDARSAQRSQNRNRNAIGLQHNTLMNEKLTRVKSHRKHHPSRLVCIRLHFFRTPPVHRAGERESTYRNEQHSHCLRSIPDEDGYTAVAVEVLQASGRMICFACIRMLTKCPRRSRIDPMVYRVEETHLSATTLIFKANFPHTASGAPFPTV